MERYTDMKKDYTKIPGGIGTGVISSPDDPRDYNIAAAMELPAGATSTDILELPEEYEVWTPPIEYQYGGTCVAHSISQVLEAVNHTLGLEHRDYSISYIYGNRRPDFDYLGEGMITRKACANTVDYGDVLRTVWEYEDPEEALDTFYAFEDKYPEICEYADLPFSKYIRLWTLNDVKAFIYKYGIPVVIAGYTKIYTKDDRYTGRHAVICYGWDKNGELKFQNSWGDYFPRGTVKFDEISECWGLVPKDVFFTDTEDLTWGEDELNLTAFKGIMLGYVDGSFKPENKITRHEMAVICGRLIKEIKKSFKK